MTRCIIQEYRAGNRQLGIRDHVIIRDAGYTTTIAYAMVNELPDHLVEQCIFEAAYAPFRDLCCAIYRQEIFTIRYDVRRQKRPQDMSRDVFERLCRRAADCLTMNSDVFFATHEKKIRAHMIRKLWGCKNTGQIREAISDIRKKHDEWINSEHDMAFKTYFNHEKEQMINRARTCEAR